MLKALTLADAYKGYTYDLDKLLPPDETIRRVKERLEPGETGHPPGDHAHRLGAPGHPGLPEPPGGGRPPGGAHPKTDGERGHPGAGRGQCAHGTGGAFQLLHVPGRRAPRLLPAPRSIRTGPALLAYLARSLFDDSRPGPAGCGPFIEDWPLYFVPATNLTRGEAVYLPLHWFYLIEEYNGPAAGNCLEEAILQGLCEVVERHVGSVISHERRTTPVIDPESVTDPVARELLEKFRKNGIKVYLRDFSLDTGIPTVAALAYDPATFPQESEIVFAAGTTPTPPNP